MNEEAPMDRRNGSDLESVARTLGHSVERLEFGPPVTHVYNPLRYAWGAHSQYLRRWGRGPKEVLLLGMNPGPWGMAQTGVPFGEVEAVREWLGIDGEIERPALEHPKRRVEGLSCARSEVSGARLWGWARDRFDSPERFFARFFVGNYCPLMFLEESGRNRTPNRLPKRELAPLLRECDHALRDLVGVLRPRYVIGVGRFAESRARKALEDWEGVVGHVLHPSPASPAANQNWRQRAESDLAALGLRI